jgi:hypothetical protein
MQMQPISRAYASQEAAKHAIFPWSRRPTVPTAQRTRVAAVLRPEAVGLMLEIYGRMLSSI